MLFIKKKNLFWCKNKKKQIYLQNQILEYSEKWPQNPNNTLIRVARDTRDYETHRESAATLNTHYLCWDTNSLISTVRYISTSSIRVISCFNGSDLCFRLTGVSEGRGFSLFFSPTQFFCYKKNRNLQKKNSSVLGFEKVSRWWR
jgi:hypothetical protein